MMLRRLLWSVVWLLCLPSLGYCSYYDESYPSSYSNYNDEPSYYHRRVQSYDDSYYNRPRYRSQTDDSYRYRQRYHYQSYYDQYGRYRTYRGYSNRPYRYVRRRSSGEDGVTGSMPSQISSIGEKVVIINPRIHMFGAYSSDGQLLRSGTATAGSGYCPDLHRSCRTRVGSFRIYSLGSSSCRSHKFPLPHGGAPMPYCMFFNGGQGLHGSYEVVRGNVSHGCVRLHVGDAEWIRFNFANIGTKVIVQPY